MSERVTISIDGGVADVRLNRADKRNALDTAMFAAIAEAGESLKGNRSVRAVVLSGQGASFCAGLDFSAFQAMAGGGDRDGDTSDIGRIGEGRITHLGQQACWVWQELEVPVVAAVHGHALGGGFQLALGADIRIVHPDTQMSVLEIRRGLSPDMTATQLLRRYVGLDVAKELTWTGRMVSGREAKDLGIATKLSDSPVDDALALAADIAAKSPNAIRAGKRLLNMAEVSDLATGFAAERREIGALIGSPNQVEAVTAFFEKRPAVYTD